MISLSAARRVRRSRLEIAYAISLPAWIYTLLGNNISSGSPDVTSSCLIIHLFLTFAAFIMTRTRRRERDCLELVGAGAVSLCAKLNTLGMVAGVCGVAMLFLVLEKGFPASWRTKALLGARPPVLLGFWVYRGVLLSGYPLFPSRLIAVPVAWKVKASDADQCRDDIVDWARIPYGDQKRRARRIVVGAAMDQAGGSAGYSVRLAHRNRSGRSRGLAAARLDGSPPSKRLLFFDASVRSAPLHTTFWILTAPEPRYFGSAAWLFASTPILGLIAAQRSFAFLSALANLYLCAVPMAGLILDTRWAWATPDPKFPEIPRASLAEFQNSFGLRYYAPIEGNQSFDSALPASNSRLANIGLLDPAAGIAGGFRPIERRSTPLRRNDDLRLLFRSSWFLSRRGSFFGYSERRLSSVPRDGVDLPRTVAGLCLVGRTPANQPSVLSHSRAFRGRNCLGGGAYRTCSLLFGGASKMDKKRVAAALAWTVFLLGISFLAFVPVLNGCTKSMCHIDLGLYYLKLIRWTQTFPIVPGLVNVQEQLAFNQNAFLITSLFDSLVPNRWGIFLIAGFLPWLGLSLSVFAIVRLLLLRLQRRERAHAIEIAYAISLPAWLSTLATSRFPAHRRIASFPA